MKPGLSVIEAEHRVLGKLLRGLKALTDQVAAGQADADMKLLHAIVDYIALYPERYHHPKETRHLFNRLRMRTDELDGLLDRLEGEHVAGEMMMSGLRKSMLAYENGNVPDPATFAAAAARFAEFYWEHMRLEEEVILPEARRIFTDDDWDDLDFAFAGHLDPLVAAGGRIELADLPGVLQQIDAVVPA